MADQLIFLSVNERAQCTKNACWVFETVQIILIIKSLIRFTEKVYGSSPYSPRALKNENTKNCIIGISPFQFVACNRPVFSLKKVFLNYSYKPGHEQLLKPNIKMKAKTHFNGLNGYLSNRVAKQTYFIHESSEVNSI